MGDVVVSLKVYATSTYSAETLADYIATLSGNLTITILGNEVHVGATTNVIMIGVAEKLSNLHIAYDPILTVV